MIFWLLLNIKKQTIIFFFKKDKKNYIFYIFLFLLFTQIIFGAFVSGLDAGRIYQTWPLMNDAYFPNDTKINDFYDFFIFDNHALVQFYHRNIAYLILVYSIFIGFLVLQKNTVDLRKPFYLVAFFLVIQIILGIFTLLTGLNIYLASTHQIVSLLLVLSVINLCYNHIK